MLLMLPSKRPIPIPSFVCGRIHRYTKQLSVRKRLFGKNEFKYVCQSRWFFIKKLFIRGYPWNKFNPWTNHITYAPTRERLIDLLIQRLEHLDDPFFMVRCRRKYMDWSIKEIIE